MNLAARLNIGRGEGVLREQPDHDAQQIRIARTHASARHGLTEKQRIAAAVESDRAGVGERDFRHTHGTRGRWRLRLGPCSNRLVTRMPRRVQDDAANRIVAARRVTCRGTEDDPDPRTEITAASIPHDHLEAVAIEFEQQTGIIRCTRLAADDDGCQQPGNCLPGL